MTWKAKWKALALLGLLALPVLEVGSHVVARAAVPADADWREAAAFVRAQLAARDLITSAPSWTDPLLRSVLGERIDLAMAGRSDTAPFERIWSLSIRGARPKDAPAQDPAFEQRFGGVTVQRWDLGRSNVVLDLTEQIASRALSMDVSHGSAACTWQKLRPARGGGLGYGVLPPVERAQCGGGGAPWVAPVVLEDLSLAPRRCIFQPPGVGAPMRVVLRDVALRERLVFYGGLYYEHERMRQGTPISITLRAGEREIGRMVHRDGEGWKRLDLATTEGRADLAIEVSSTTQRQRGFCWSATVRSGADR